MSAPKAWFVVCMDEAKPDGPANVFGPFNTQERAQHDADNGAGCDGQHVLVYGGGSSHVRGSASDAWCDSYSYYRANRDAIPPNCRHLFGRDELVRVS